jgi:hypothetical protein
MDRIFIETSLSFVVAARRKSRSDAKVIRLPVRPLKCSKKNSFQRAGRESAPATGRGSIVSDRLPYLFG